MAGATTAVLVAGTLTFGNQWIQEKKVTWQIPVATLLVAAATEAVSHWSKPAAAGIAFFCLLGAATTKVNGKSPVDELSSIVGKKT